MLIIPNVSYEIDGSPSTQNPSIELKDAESKIDEADKTYDPVSSAGSLHQSTERYKFDPKPCSDSEGLSGRAGSNPIIKASSYESSRVCEIEIPASASLFANMALLSVLYKLKADIEQCSKLFRHYECQGCHKKFYKAVFTCSIPYCWECRVSRYAKFFKRLMDKDIRSRRLFHLSIGFKPIPIGDIPDFKHHQRVLQRWTRRVRKMGYNIRGCRVLDVSIRFDVEGGMAFWHYHFALLPEIGFKDCASEFNKAIDWASKGELCNVNVIGYRSKNSLFHYIAKRQASIFGHEHDKTFNPEGHYGYKDFVDILDYTQHFHKKRKLIWVGSPVGLVYNTAPDSSIKCPHCGCEDVVEMGLVDYWEVKGLDPPPRLGGDNDNNLMRLVRSRGEWVESYV